MSIGLQANGQSLPSNLDEQLRRCLSTNLCDLQSQDGILEISSRLTFQEIVDTIKFFPRHGLVYSNFGPDSSPELSSLFDQGHIRAFETPVGRMICDKVGPYASDLHQILGISIKAATQIIQSCRYTKTNQISIASRKNLLSEYRKIVFVIAPKNELMLEAWTTKTGATIFFLSPDEANISHFTQLVVHELATFLDRTDQERQALLSLPPTGQSEIFCLASNILADPLVRLATSSIRAKKIEELFLGHQALAMGTCQEILAQEINHVQSISQKLLMSSHISKSCEHSNFELRDLERIHLISDSGSNRNQNLCEFLTTPRLVLQREALTEGGPRPRTTGGWKQTRTEGPDLRSEGFFSSGEQSQKSVEEKLKTFLQMQSPQTIDRIVFDPKDVFSLTSQKLKNEK